MDTLPLVVNVLPANSMTPFIPYVSCPVPIEVAFPINDKVVPLAALNVVLPISRAP